MASKMDKTELSNQDNLLIAIKAYPTELFPKNKKTSNKNETVCSRLVSFMRSEGFYALDPTSSSSNIILPLSDEHSSAKLNADKVLTKVETELTKTHKLPIEVEPTTSTKYLPGLQIETPNEQPPTKRSRLISENSKFERIYNQEFLKRNEGSAQPIHKSKSSPSPGLVVSPHIPEVHPFVSASGQLLGNSAQFAWQSSPVGYGMMPHQPHILVHPALFQLCLNAMTGFCATPRFPVVGGLYNMNLNCNKFETPFYGGMQSQIRPQMFHQAYKRPSMLPNLACVGPLQNANNIFQSMHEGLVQHEVTAPQLPVNPLFRPTTPSIISRPNSETKSLSPILPSGLLENEILQPKILLNLPVMSTLPNSQRNSTDKLHDLIQPKGLIIDQEMQPSRISPTPLFKPTISPFVDAYKNPIMSINGANDFEGNLNRYVYPTANEMRSQVLKNSLQSKLLLCDNERLLKRDIGECSKPPQMPTILTKEYANLPKSLSNSHINQNSVDSKQTKNKKKVQSDFYKRLSEFHLDQKNTEKILQVVKDVEHLGDLPLDSASHNPPPAPPIPPSSVSESVINLTQEDVEMEEGEVLGDLTDFASHEGVTGEEPMDQDPSPALMLDRDSRIDLEIQREMIEKVQSPDYLAMNVKRKQLPAFVMKQEILKTISENQVTVISGETGCGKTTQIPQYLLEHGCLRGNGSCTRIIVTQPRRISAISVAERVAMERGQRLCEDVGYHIRLEARLPRRPRGSILFCTTGILLQRLHSDPLLQSMSHIIVDEVHEREMLGDFLITMLKRLSNDRPELRIILMSATLNAEMFSAFFDNCPILKIPGRTFPVEAFFLEDVLKLTKFDMHPRDLDKFSRNMALNLSKRANSVGNPTINAQIRDNFKHWLRTCSGNLTIGSRQVLEAIHIHGLPPSDLIATTIDYIMQTTESGAILTFVPGLGDIFDTIKSLQKLNPALYCNSSRSVVIYSLHSKLPSARQRCVFEPAQRGVRKIVVATNIAETSITIEDVVYVVDCGQIKVTTYDPHTNTSTLAPVLVSKANAAQRRGRAGRVQPGICYHLFSSFAMDRVMLENLPPEITRIRLEDIILRIKVLELGPVTSFLASCMDPPALVAIQRTLKFLRDIQALRPKERNPATELMDSCPTVQTSKMTKKQKKRFLDAAVANGRSIAAATGDESNDDNDVLTPLGYHLANLPLDPQCAKLLILGGLFCCLEPVLAVAACLAFKDPFEVPVDKVQVADMRRAKLAEDSLSDHWVYYTVLSEYMMQATEAGRQQYCWKNFLNQRTMNDLCRLMREFTQMLFERQYISSEKMNDPISNRNSHDIKIFRAVLAGAFYPNLIMATPRKNGQGSFTMPIVEGRPGEGAVGISTKSVNSHVKPVDRVWLAYFSRMKLDHGAKSTIFDTTMLGARPLIFFSAKLTPLKIGDEDFLNVDDWVKFKSTAKLPHLFKGLKGCLDKLLDCKIRRPGATNWDTACIEGRILQTIVDLFATEPPPPIDYSQASESTGFHRRGPARDRH